MKSRSQVLLLNLFAMALFSSITCSAFALADGPEEVRGSRRLIAQCYNPAASNRPGAGTILKMKLETLRTKSGAQIIAGLGVDMIPASNSPGFPAIFSTGGVFTHFSGAGDQSGFFFDRGGSYKYLDVDSQPLVVRTISLDRRQKTVTVEIAPGFDGRALVAKGCRFF